MGQDILHLGLINPKYGTVVGYLTREADPEQPKLDRIQRLFPYSTQTPFRKLRIFDPVFTRSEKTDRPGSDGLSSMGSIGARVPAHTAILTGEGRGAAPVRKIPPDLRKNLYRTEKSFFRRLIVRLREDSQLQRSVVQFSFAFLCLWIGIEFYLFVQWGMAGGQAQYVPRPPGAEGFLPISGLISLKYWIATGIINEIHPSALFILLAVIAVSWAAGKSFCSWLCPVGTLSESLWILGKKLIGRNLRIPRWLDYPLRSLKYLLLFFFVWSILQMDIPALRMFINSPYNKVADVKMYVFFAHLSEFAFWTLIALVVLSVPIKNFWCRYLCPYGALLGIVGLFSPMKITRNKSRCIDCELCTKACPSSIAVHRIGSSDKGSPFGQVWSDECTSCLSCVEICPVKETLDVRLAGRSRVPTWAIGALIVSLFVAVTGTAMLAGRWKNKITEEEYLMRFQRLDSYQHFQGNVPEYGPND